MKKLIDMIMRFLGMFFEYKAKKRVKTVKPLAVKWLKSPHFSSRRGKAIKGVILHHTGSNSLQGTLSWFKDPSSKVSAHYVIGRKGNVFQMVKDKDKAWHAGASVIKGVRNANAVTIGIELVGNGVTPFTAPQYKAVSHLCRNLKKRYKIRDNSWIKGHAHVAVPKGRKTDPSPFNWDHFFELVDKT